jgi:hypothetical protein
MYERIHAEWLKNDDAAVLYSCRYARFHTECRQMTIQRCYIAEGTRRKCRTAFVGELLSLKGTRTRSKVKISMRISRKERFSTGT